MATVVCPHYNDAGNSCKLYNTRQSDYQKKTFCITRDNWLKCANYQASKKK